MLIIADENIAPGILADIHVQSMTRRGKKADEAKADLQTAAADMLEIISRLTHDLGVGTTRDLNALAAKALGNSTLEDSPAKPTGTT